MRYVAIPDLNFEIKLIKCQYIYIDINTKIIYNIIAAHSPTKGTPVRIVLHNTSDSRMLASLNLQGPPWLGGSYHPMGNGYELRVQPLGSGKAMIFTRLIDAKEASPVTVPIVGYFMTVDIEIDESGKPTWSMHDIVSRLLGEFKLPAIRVNVHPAGRRLELVSWQKREVKHSQGARYLTDVPTDDTPIDAVDSAYWAIDTHERYDGKIIHDVHVWTDLAQRPSDQKSLWTALSEVVAKAG